jgi:hypothetical protein
MKTNHLWALLKLEASFFARFLFFPVIFAGEVIVFSGMNYFDGTLLAAMLSLFGTCTIFWSYGFLFQDGRMGYRCAERKYATRTLEFPFSRAFDRRTVFGARSLWFFASAAIPLATFVVASFWHSDRSIRISQDAVSPSPAVQAYYLTHFPGAVLQTADVTPSLPNPPAIAPQRHVFRTSIVLPHAQTELALTILWAGIIAAALYQALMLGTLRFKWCQRLLPFILAFVGPGAVFAFRMIQIFPAAQRHLSFDRPPAMDKAQAWVIHNPLLLILIGTTIIWLALRFSCRRFVRQEVLA